MQRLIPFLHTSYRCLAYHSDTRRGYASLRFDRDMTPWYWGYDKTDDGIWSFSIHCPWAQLLVIGPFCGYEKVAK